MILNFDWHIIAHIIPPFHLLIKSFFIIQTTIHTTNEAKQQLIEIACSLDQHSNCSIDQSHKRLPASTRCPAGLTF